MIGRIKKINSVLPELLLGIVLLGILFEAAGIWFVKDKNGYAIGIVIGTAAAAAMAVHMAFAINAAVNMGSTGAEKKIRLGSLLRYLVAAIVVIVVAVTGFANPLAVFLGIMSLKAAAYLQPFTHRIMRHFNL